MFDATTEAVIVPTSTPQITAGLYLRNRSDNGAPMMKPVPATLGTSEISRLISELSAEFLKAALAGQWRPECNRAAAALKLQSTEVEAATIEAMKAAVDTFAATAKVSLEQLIAGPAKAKSIPVAPPAAGALVKRYGVTAAPVAKEGK